MLPYTKLKRLQKATVTFKLIQGHWQSCQSMAIHDFLLVFLCNYVSILHYFQDIISYFSECDRDHAHLMNIVIPLNVNHCFRENFSVVIVNIWNSLPNSINDESTTDIFKAWLDKYCLQATKQINLILHPIRLVVETDLRNHFSR